MTQNQMNSALDQFNLTVLINPDNRLAQLNLGDVVFSQGNIESAFNYWSLANQAENLRHLVWRRVRYLNRKSLSFSDWIAELNSEILELTP